MCHAGLKLAKSGAWDQVNVEAIPLDPLTNALPDITKSYAPALMHRSVGRALATVECRSYEAERLARAGIGSVDFPPRVSLIAREFSCYGYT